MTRRPEVVRPGIRAHYASVCDRCGDPIAKGDPIATRGGGWSHVACASEGRE